MVSGVADCAAFRVCQAGPGAAPADRTSGTDPAGGQTPGQTSGQTPGQTSGPAAPATEADGERRTGEVSIPPGGVHLRKAIR